MRNRWLIVLIAALLPGVAGMSSSFGEPYHQGGTTTVYNTQKSVMARLVEKNGCWEWQGARTEGYGKVHFACENVFVHRLLYEWFRGPIEAGTEIHHQCGNRICANPAHLEAITRAEHVHKSATRAAVNARKTHCPQGHPYDSPNTFIRIRRGLPNRQCRICLKAQDHRKYEKQVERRRLLLCSGMARENDEV
jgi:hypothetical protein